MTHNSVKYQIFISSTYEDLIPERSSVIETILRFHHFPVGMEMFNANNKTQWKVITDTIDSSDIYILIVGQMYGSLTKAKKNPISFTQKEFEYALKKRRKGELRILCFIHNGKDTVSPTFMETDGYKIKKLKEFRSIIDKSNLTRIKFGSKDELSGKVATSLADEIHSLNAESTSAGWVKKTCLAPLNEKPLSNEFILKALLNCAESFKSELEDVTTYKFDNLTNCVIERIRKQTVLNDHITHAVFNYKSEKIGTSELLEIIDLERYTRGMNLPYEITEQDGINFGFIIFFDKVVARGNSIKYRYKVKINDFMSSLIENGSGIMEYFSYPNNVFIKKTDIISFPDNKIFEYLQLNFTQTILGKIVNYKLDPVIKDGRKLFEIKYESTDFDSITLEFTKLPIGIY